MNQRDFASNLLEADLSEIDVAVGQLWWTAKEDFEGGLSVSEIAARIVQGGGSRPNTSRLRKNLAKDQRVVALGDGFRANRRKQAEMEKFYSKFAGPQKPVNTGSVLDPQIFENARSYVKGIVWQINAAYDHALFDCAAVMCRRLLETLSIDAFDKQGQMVLIRDGSGELLMFSGIISALKGQQKFHVGRQTKRALDKVKAIGDMSAHNRTYIAREKHIDDVRDILSAACMDLLHLSGQD